MKIQTTIAMMLLLPEFTMAQNTFFRHFPSTEYDSFYSAVQTEDSGYILCGSKQIGGTSSVFNSWVVKLDDNGNLVHDTLLSSTDVSSGYSYIRKSENDNSRFFISGYLDRADSMNFTGIWEYNQDISLLRVFGTEFKDTLLNTPVGYINLGDTTFYLYSGTRRPNFSSTDISLLKLNSNDNSYTLFEPAEHRLRWPSGVLFDSIAQGIKITYMGAEVKNGLPVNILSLDLSLSNILAYQPNVSFTNLNYGFNLLNDNSIILTGFRDDFITGLKYLLAYKFDNDLVVLDSLTLFVSADTITYPGWGQSVLSLDSSLVVVGIYNLDPSTFWQPTPTWIQVSRINADFELTDQYYYGGDGLYFPYDIISTSDGGMLIVGNYYNPNAIPLVLQRDPFVLKLNSEGLIVNVNNPEQPIAQEAIVLPNPGKEYLHVKLAIQHKTARFQLYNTGGSLVLETDLSGDMQRVNTEHLASGVYIYRISGLNRVIGSGKWVKE